MAKIEKADHGNLGEYMEAMDTYMLPTGVENGMTTLETLGQFLKNSRCTPHMTQPLHIGVYPREKEIHISYMSIRLPRIFVNGFICNSPKLEIIHMSINTPTCG